jgi:para-aminobenzoate synthetase
MIILHAVTLCHDAHFIELTVGAGGAIVILSDPEEEYQEMLLKAQAVLNG